MLVIIVIVIILVLGCYFFNIFKGRVMSSQWPAWARAGWGVWVRTHHCSRSHMGL